MDITGLLPIIRGNAAYRRLLAACRLQESGCRAVVLPAARPYLLAALNQDWPRPLLVVTAQPETARRLYEQVLAWNASGQVLLFPEPDVLPYGRLAVDISTETARVQALAALAGARSGLAAETTLVIAAAPALMSLVPPHGEFAAAFHTLEAGMVVNPLALMERWEALGYRAESAVAVPGTMSRRGGILDIYPPTAPQPVRLDFLGNTVESLRRFDPASQRSAGEASPVVVGPARELLAPFRKNHPEAAALLNGLDLSACHPEARQQYRQEIAQLLERQRPAYCQFYAALFHRGCLLDYLPPGSLVVLDEPENIERRVKELDAQFRQVRADMLAGGELPPNYPRPYLSWEEIAPLLVGGPALALTGFGREDDGVVLPFRSAPTLAGQLSSFPAKAAQMARDGQRLLVVSHQADRLAELLEEPGIISVPVSEVRATPPAGTVTLVPGSLEEGWVLDGETVLLTDAELFGFVKERRAARKRPVPAQQLYADIMPGSYVVHVEHGIARFQGVTVMTAAGVEKEYLILQYAGGDRLYVPADQIDRLSRYVGGGDREPSLSRLGTQEWHRHRQNAREATEQLARELLALYATREVLPGFAFSPDTVWQQELEASFPYVETPDQMSAQRDVKADMEQARPMDRLVCGDVGYGKTEVAVRAAFKAVMDGKQVAVLVPTTVLAEQHYRTFRERLGAFPVRVEVLSRFQSPAGQDAILSGLAAGSVDICIGTHRLLQKDVAFKDLGLLIIDEEQRFGVAHKEYLKQKRREVDVLALSATPIPRTLHMSLVGVRDMSTMEIPPEDRQPVKTFVAAYSDRLVREAVLREMERNGQVFFVHNRVQSIATVAGRLRELLPEAMVAVAHGQMPEEKLAAVMADFTAGRSDVLVCTTIIESGLDIANANTLIINQADKLGMAQLYQLRGRVGRGANLAYAYLLYNGGRPLTPVAEKRLRTIYEATGLSAGFSIALKDLEIRGAGTLLGTRQSGYISAVGFNLYCRLLAEAVAEQKARLAGEPEPPPRLPPPAIDLPLSAYLPEDYVADVNTRLGLYRKIAGMDRQEQVDRLMRELNDRFGAPPEEVHNLLYAVRVKLLAERAGVESVTSEDGQITVRMFDGMRLEQDRLAPFRGRVAVGLNQLRFSCRRPGGEWKALLEKVLMKLGEVPAGPRRPAGRPAP